METCIVVGGNNHLSFVLHDKDIVSYRLRTSAHEATIRLHSCAPFEWFLSKVAPELENKNSIWHNGIYQFSFVKNYWVLAVDTDIIPITISPDEDED